MTEQAFEAYAAEAEQKAITAQVQSAVISFVEHQARAWDELQEWWAEAQSFGGPPETANGSGSTVAATEGIRGWLQSLLARYRVRTMLDVACGDWNWMRLLDLGDVEYTGWDVNERIIHRARSRLKDLLQRGRTPDVLFERVNILTVPEMPLYDLILCRDFLTHLPNGPVSEVLDKFKESGGSYLLATNYPETQTNAFIYRPQDFSYFGYMERPINLELPPFSLAKLEAHDETPGPGGVLAQPHELALFEIKDK